MLKPAHCILAENEYGIYAVPRSSRCRPAAASVIRGKVYEASTIAFIRHNMGTGDVVHAGTYFGDFLPGIASGCAPGARIWAFEPNSQNFHCAEWTVRINKLANVHLLHAGLSDKPGKGSVLTKNVSGVVLGGASRLVEHTASPLIAPGLALTESIDVLSVDAVVPSDRSLSVIQLDVEGHELKALKGSVASIERSKPLIIIERNRPDECIAFLAGLGYRVKQELGPNFVLSATA